MATPPETPPRPTHNAGILQSPPGIEKREFPTFASVVPTRHEENTIAQRSMDIAKRNMMALFGKEIVVAAKSSRVVRSARSPEEDERRDTDMNLMLNYTKNTKSEGWRHQGSQWVPRLSQSDPGVDMGMLAHVMVSLST